MSIRENGQDPFIQGQNTETSGSQTLTQTNEVGTLTDSNTNNSNIASQIQGNNNTVEQSNVQQGGGDNGGGNGGDN